MRIKKITNFLLVVSAVIFIFASGFRLGQFYQNKNFTNPYSLKQNLLSPKKDVDLSLFWDVWNKLEEKYVDKKKLDHQKMLYGAIKGLTASLDDPYTFFLTPEENKQSKDELGGEFEGIGAQLGLKNNQIIIIAPLKNSPAEKAGIKAGDYILKVDDQSTKDWSLTQAVNKIRGKKGTPVKLTLLRNNKEIEVKIIRDQINVPSLELTYENKNNKKIAVLKVFQFGDKTISQWNEAIKEIANYWQKKEIAGLIVDLRDNPGGYLEGAVYLTSEFLPLGKEIVRQESTTIDNKIYKVDRRGKLLDIPLVIIINQGSASASEIMAGSLRDHQRAILIGEKTFGKGSVQEALDLSENAGLHITVAKWILPNGDWINSKGIEPQIKVELKLEKGNTLTRETDTQLDKALEVINK